MLVIRKKQMEDFQQQAERDFVDSVVKQLRSDHAAAVKDIPEDKLVKRVEYGIRRAREYGLTWKNNLSTFVTLMFEIAPGFDRFPAFQKHLADERFPPDRRMSTLLEEMKVVDYQAIHENSDLTNWPAEML
ncbi:MAG: hypothetical protein ACMUIA_10490 [bacterium]